MVSADGRHRLDLGLPGRSAQANTVMALAASGELGVPPTGALLRWRSIRSIAGRYEVTSYAGAELHLHLAKNPAGWCDTLDLVGRDDLPVILALNARAEDGRDPSWIWDVPFEQLGNRPVAIIGERSRDLAVRLAYASVPVCEAASLREATAYFGSAPAHVVANYSAFQQVRTLVRRGR